MKFFPIKITVKCVLLVTLACKTKITHAVFIYLFNFAEAEKAKDSLNGRYFGGRRVICEIYDYALYKNHDLSA